MVPLSKLMRDSHNGDQFEGCKRLLLRFLVPVFRFYHLFCAITGKCLGLPATVWDLCRIPMRSRHSPPESLLFAEFCKKFPVLRRMSRGDRFVSACDHTHPASA